MVFQPDTVTHAFDTWVGASVSAGLINAENDAQVVTEYCRIMENIGLRIRQYLPAEHYHRLIEAIKESVEESIPLAQLTPHGQTEALPYLSYEARTANPGLEDLIHTLVAEEIPDTIEELDS